MNGMFFFTGVLYSSQYGMNALFGILEFQKLWRSIPVDSMDEEKIEEYLKRQGISSMQEAGPKKIVRVINCKSLKKDLFP